MSPEKVVKDIRRKTRRRFSVEEKLRMLLEGLRGEESMATLYRRSRRDGLGQPCSCIQVRCGDTG